MRGTKIGEMARLLGLNRGKIEDISHDGREFVGDH
jgi:hypothetical protein